MTEIRSYGISGGVPAAGGNAPDDAMDHPPFRSRDITPDDPLYHALLDVLYSVHAPIRQDPETRWVMGRDWYDRVRTAAYLNSDDPEPDPGKRDPAPGDLLLGVRLDVTDDDSLPHLENSRYPPGWGPASIPLPPVPDDAVNHPAHYGGADDPYEAIKVIEAWELGFHLGNCVKYIARAGRKDDAVTDLCKAAWYLDREIRRLAPGTGDP